VHRRPPLLLRVLRALLCVLEPGFRSLKPWFRALPSRLRALGPWGRAQPARHRALEPWFRAVPERIRELPPVLESRFRGLRSLSLESVLRDAERLARRPSRLTLGVAAGTVLATGAVLAGVSAGSASPAAAISDQDTAREALPAEAAGQAGATGHAAPSRAAGSASAAPSASASAAPSGSRSAPASSPPPAQPAAPAPPYLIYDSLTPGAIPASAGVVATYGDGAGAVPASEVAGRKSVLWISVTGQDTAASVIAVEPGNASPAVAASWAWQRLSADPQAVARIYTYLSEWPAVQAAVASFPAQMRARIHWWIADPTGSPHIVPGSEATQWYWGPSYDISTALPSF
jgi:hypothetical protein